VEVALDVRRVVEQAAEVERADVVELLARDRLQHRRDVLDATLQRLVTSEDSGLRRLEHAVEPAENDERKDHASVLGLLVDTAKLVGDRPYEGSVVSELGIGAHAGKA
jgi:hypothetical protein